MLVSQPWTEPGQGKGKPWCPKFFKNTPVFFENLYLNLHWPPKVFCFFTLCPPQGIFSGSVLIPNSPAFTKLAVEVDSRPNCFSFESSRVKTQPDCPKGWNLINKLFLTSIYLTIFEIKGENLVTLRLSKIIGLHSQIGELLCDQRLYQTWPEISYAVSLVSQFLHAPRIDRLVVFTGFSNI